jgi:2-isopropylmalate synthase
LLLAEEMGTRPIYFDIESWRVLAESTGGTSRGDTSFSSRGTGLRDGATAEATVKLRAGGQRLAVIGEGNGPVNALDHALRQAIERLYPDVARFHLIDFRVRILDQGHGTDAITRVLIETTDGKDAWVTVGVGANIIEASWEALLDALTYGLRLHGVAALPS